MIRKYGQMQTRRSILKSMGALSVAGVTGLPTSSLASNAPRKGGTFRYAIVGASTTDTLDPVIYPDIAPGIMGWQSRNNLVEIGPGNSLVPELAESFEAEDGGKTWIFNLRQGVEFHNGKPFVAADVVFTLQRHIGDDSKSAVKPYFKEVTEILADGDHRVLVRLSAPNADFPYYLADYHLQIVPAGTENFDDGMGTGPYIMTEFKRGVRCRGVRNPNYWKAGHGNFDEVECLAISDGTARVNALISGEVDAIMFVDLKVAERIEQQAGFRLLDVQGGTHMTLPMNATIAPFDDTDIRLALKYSVDREKLVDTVLRGRGVVANDHPIPPHNPYYNADLKPRPYDPDRAKYHLKKAGVDSLAIDLSCSTAILGYGLEVGQLYQQHAKGAGIDITVNQQPPDGYWTDVWKKHAWCESYFAERPTADAIFSLAYQTGAAWNETYWGNDRFDFLLTEARSELDNALRHEIYNEMQVILHEQGSSVTPFFASTLDAVSDAVQTPDVSGLFNLDGGRAADRWWY